VFLVLPLDHEPIYKNYGKVILLQHGGVTKKIHFRRRNSVTKLLISERENSSLFGLTQLGTATKGVRRKIYKGGNRKSKTEK